MLKNIIEEDRWWLIPKIIRFSNFQASFVSLFTYARTGKYSIFPKKDSMIAASKQKQQAEERSNKAVACIIIM